ncbi:hypothetical protein BH20CHL4_BH20CHL4_02900 [soil metagenome]
MLLSWPASVQPGLSEMSETSIHPWIRNERD